jgi:hypothetical protein
VSSTATIAALAFAFLATAAAAPGRSDGLGVQPFTAVFGLEWKGLTAAHSTLELKSLGNGAYRYSSSNHARGVFRVAFPDAINQTSSFEIRDGHVAPLTYEEDNGNEKDNVSLRFDWNARRVRGTAQGKSVDQPLEPGTQDPLSVQIELMRELAAGSSPSSFLLFDKHEATRYNYTREQAQTLDTPLGHLETLIYRSDRPGSDRVMRLWLAPSLGYLPVQAERRRKGKVEFGLHIRELKRSAP